jgi:hypothetical protein
MSSGNDYKHDKLTQSVKENEVVKRTMHELEK